ncbi:MAG: T9SS type A sorting domain-containing protein [Bacteroidia bacterium]
MKKLLLLSGVAFLFSGVASAQTLDNGGFETWAADGSNCQSPVGWGTLNGSTSILSICTATKETVAVHGGTSALKLTTKFIGFPINQTAPGICTNGTVNTTTEAIEGGDPFTERPVAFTGWYQAGPVNGDSYSFEAALTKWNGSTRDTLGTASFSGTATVSTYTQFTATVAYTSSATPDTLVVVLLPSNPVTPQTNSFVIFDDLGYTTSTVGINAADAKENITVYPNPVSENLFINMAGIQDASVSIFDITGKKVFHQNLNEKVNTINVNALANGMYVYQVSSNTSETLKTGKFISK